MRHSNLQRATALSIVLALLVSACGSSVVQIRPPYSEKIRPGDGVKVLDKQGTLHSGRVTYVDASMLVIRTPRQTISDKPVKAARFGTTIPWETVHSIKVAGTLDSRRRLISNEEIRINRRTDLRTKLMTNVGLLGLAASFLIGSAIQEHMAPADPLNLTGSHGKARLAFWSTLLAGTAASAGLGYRLGLYLDDQRAIARIERERSQERQSQAPARRPAETPVLGRPIGP